jgi:outer membrane lipoprotein SlyB
MDHLHHVYDTRPAVAPVPAGSPLPRRIWVVGGLLLAVIAALASALMLRGPASGGAPPGIAAGTADGPPGAVGASPGTGPKRAALATAPEVDGADLRDTASAAPCHDCGMVEGLREVRVQGQGTGLGAGAGGLLGGVVGHQLGGGNGKAAMTVLGAVGGGLAGNEVEKRARAETAYAVRVRMDDGSLRTLTLAQPPAPGARVSIEGKSLRVIGTPPAAAAPDAPRVVHTRGTAGSGT